jgi:hypothetical protein
MANTIHFAVGRASLTFLGSQKTRRQGINSLDLFPFVKPERLWCYGPTEDRR